MTASTSDQGTQTCVCASRGREIGIGFVHGPTQYEYIYSLPPGSGSVESTTSGLGERRIDRLFNQGVLNPQVSECYADYL